MASAAATRIRVITRTKSGLLQRPLITAQQYHSPRPVRSRTWSAGGSAGAPCY